MEIPFAKPHFSEGDIRKINKFIKKILDSGWLTNHTFVKKFEEKVAQYLGVKHAVAMNGCTSALHSALLTLDIGKEDEVIVPTNTFISTAHVVLFAGGTPVFADVSPDTFNISPDSVHEQITENTVGIIPVHVGGEPVEMDALRKIADEHNLFIIEDAAHALGSTYKGENCGTLGKVGCFSFYPSKIITTGEGGMLVTDDTEIAETARAIRNEGESGVGPRAFTRKGYNFRMPEFCGAVGCIQMEHLEEFISHRNKIATFYDDLLKEIPWIKPQKTHPENRSTYYAYITMLNESAPLPRDEIVEILKEKGIGTSIIYHPVHLQPFYRQEFGYMSGDFPVSEKIGERSLALPMFNNMSLPKAQRVVEALKNLS